MLTRVFTIVESAKLLESLRVNAGMSVQQLADKSGFSHSNIYKIESNPSATPSIDVAKKWVMATKPKDSSIEEWFNIAIRLLVDDRTAMQLEGVAATTDSNITQPVRLINRLLPNRFLAYLKS